MGNYGGSSRSYRAKNSGGDSRNDAGMTPEQERMVSAYVLDRDHEVDKVRRIQQGENIGPEQQKYKEMGDTIEQFIADNETHSDTIWRGIRAPFGYADGLEVGQVIDQNGTSSWSKDASHAFIYATRPDYPGRPLLFVLPGGTMAADIDDWSRKSAGMQDGELLVSKNRKMRVAEVNRNQEVEDSGIYVDIVVLEEM